jgi:hypothetical protein
MLPAGPASPAMTEGAAIPEAEDFVRFCYARRRVGWPELYDEMCAVATRGLYRGMGHDGLAEIGIGFSLFETPRLAALVSRIVGEEQAARRAARAAALDALRPAEPSLGADAARTAEVQCADGVSATAA